MIKILKLLYSLKNYITHLFSPQKIIFYIGGYPNIQNVGDVALFEAYQFYFRDFKLIHFVGGRFERMLYRLYKRKSINVLAGGTLINHMCLREAQDAKEVLGAFHVLGTGVAQSSYWQENPHYTNQIKQWEEVLSISSTIGVRGPLSQREIHEYTHLQSFIFGDPVLSLATAKEHRSLVLEQQLLIGLNVGRSLGNVQGGEENLKELFIKLSKKLRSLHYKLVWFVVCPEDLEITQEIAEDIDIIYPIYKDYKEYLKYVSQVHFFIGVKLHAVCLATCEFIPSIMIEYRPKCLDFMASIGQEHLSVPADSCNLELIETKIQFILNHYEETSEHLKKQILSFQALQKDIVEKILSSECL